MFVGFEDFVIPIRILSNDLTCGWLFSEVQRRYNKFVTHLNDRGFKVVKRLIVALKSEDGNPTLDYYLTDMAK